MKESHFVEQNKEKWNEFESDLKSKKKDPEKIRKLFIEITDDLSFARTFYKSRLVNNYLNGVAQLLFQEIYKNEKGPANQFKKFWTTDLPLYLYQARRELLISLLIFAAAMAIGVFSAMNDPEFNRTILGDAYIEMTEENIAKNDPMAVYKDKHALDMFLGISLNNIRVAFFTFISGVLAGIGTLYFLIYNGVMLGAFQYFFVERGLFLESFLTIWQHGALEISSIVIAGAAGLTLGKGLIFPGSYDRSVSFRLGARRGLKIMAGLVPLFLIAAFIEGFVTRFTEINDGIRALNIAVSFGFIFFYFVWYPRRVYQKNPELAVPESPPHRQDKQAFNPHQINSSARIIGLAIQKVGSQLVFLLKWGTGISLILAALVMLASQGADKKLIENLVYYQGFSALTNLAARPYMALGYFILFGAAQGLSIFSLEREKLSHNTLAQNILKLLPSIALSSFLMSLPFLLHFYLGLILLLIIAPASIMIVSGSAISDDSLGVVLKRTWGYLKSNVSTLAEVILKIGGITLIFSLIFNSNAVQFYMNVLELLFYSGSDWYDLAYLGLSTTIFFIFLFLSVSVYAFAAHYLMYTNQEIRTAAHLQERIKHMGDRNRILGMDQE